MWDTGKDQTWVKSLLHTELKSVLTNKDRRVAGRPTLSPVDYEQAENETYIIRAWLSQFTE